MTTPATPGRRDLAIVLLLTAAALALRALLWNAIDDHPWWLVPLLDARLYHRLGESVAAGGLGALGELPVGPLYPLLLGGLYRVLPADPWTVRIAQGLLGAALPAILFLVGSRIGGRAAGVAAGLLALLCGPLLAQETDVTPATPSVLAFTLLLVLCLPGGSPTRRAFPLGVAFALAASLRPNLLLLLPLPLLLAWRRAGRVAAPLLAAAGMALVVLPQAWLIARGGGSGLVAPHGGINLYIGNHQGAGGTWRLPWPWHGDVADFNLAAPRAEAERRTGRPMTAGEVSSFWEREALRFWIDRPGEALRLTARKVRLLVNDLEAPLNLPYPILRREVGPLRWLPVTWGALLPLALLGLLLRPRGSSAEPMLALLLAGGLATILPFFVADRYRLCLYPAAIILAGLGIARLAARPFRIPPLLPVAAALLLAVVAFLPSGIGLAGEELSYRFNVGVNLLRTGRLDEADAAFAALADGPLAARSRINRGVIALSRGDRPGAVTLLREALAIEPGNPVAAARLAEAEAPVRRGGRVE